MRRFDREKRGVSHAGSVSEPGPDKFTERVEIPVDLKKTGGQELVLAAQEQFGTEEGDELTSPEELAEMIEQFRSGKVLLESLLEPKGETFVGKSLEEIHRMLSSLNKEWPVSAWLAKQPEFKQLFFDSGLQAVDRVRKALEAGENVDDEYLKYVTRDSDLRTAVKDAVDVAMKEKQEEINREVEQILGAEGFSNLSGLEEILERLEEINQISDKFQFDGNKGTNITITELIFAMDDILDDLKEPKITSDDLRYRGLQFPEDFGLKDAVEGHLNDILRSRELFRQRRGVAGEVTDVFPAQMKK